MKQYFLNPPYSQITLLSVSFVQLLIVKVLILLLFEMHFGSLILKCSSLSSDYIPIPVRKLSRPYHTTARDPELSSLQSHYCVDYNWAATVSITQ